MLSALLAGFGEVAGERSARSLPVSLEHVDCGGPASCLAARGQPAGGPRVVAWDGEAWHTVADPPVSIVRGLSCPTPGWCVVFGGDRRGRYRASRKHSSAARPWEA